VKIEMIKPENLKEYWNNPRKTKKLEMLEQSIEGFGFINPVIAYKHNKKNIIIAGHQRVQAAINKNIEKIPVIFPPFKNIEEARKYLIVDNRTAEAVAEWDTDKLQLELAELDLDFLDFQPFKTEKSLPFEDWDFSEIKEPFWFVIRGPLVKYKKIKHLLAQITDDEIIITTSNETAREQGYTTEWDKTKKNYLEENSKCEICGSQSKLTVHHINPLLDGGEKHEYDNLQTLCRDCHEKAHGRKK